MSIGIRLQYDETDLESMLERSINAEVYLASNSSLSYWIALLRGPQRLTITPRPFNKTGTLSPPDFTVDVDAVYS